MRVPRFVRSAPNWPRVAVTVVLVSFTVVLSLYVPQLLIPLLVLGVAWLLWERLRINNAIRDLAARIAVGDLDAKLEVGDSAWGALCHAVNGLLQQQRRQQRMQTMLPWLPAHVIASLVNTPLPAEGLPRAMTVLVIGYATATLRSVDESIHLRIFQAMAAAAQQQAEIHGALLERSGDTLLLAFGAFDDRPLPTTLRSAMKAAKELRSTWSQLSQADVPLPTLPSLCLSLASGTGRAVALPGLGYTIIGTPLDQGLRLQYLAAACPEYTLLCSEESYLLLRRLDNSPWLPTDMRLVQPHRPAQVVYALRW